MTSEIIASKKQIGKFCAVALMLFGAGRAAHAATDVWTGAGDGVNWSSANNWNLHAAPSAYDVLLFQGGTGTSPNNDLASATNGSLIFSNNASAFSVSGNAVTLSHLGSANTIGITNAAANTQTIGLNVNLDWGNYAFVSPSGSLALNGQLAAPAGGIAFLGDNLTSSSLTTDSQGLISGLGGTALKFTSGSATFSGLATITGGSIGVYTPSTTISSGALGDAAQTSPLNVGLTAAPGSGTKVIYTLTGGSANSFANTFLVNDSYTGNIQIGNDTGSGQNGQLILGSSADNWVGGIYVYGSPAATAVILTNQFLTAGPDSGSPTPGTVVLAVNGSSGNNYMNVYSAITNNPTGGAVSLIKTGPGGVFYGPVTKGAYTGGTYINQGTFQLNGNNPTCVSAGPYFIAANAGFYVRDSMTNDITISPGVNNAYSAAIKLENYTLSGKLTVSGTPVSLPPGDRIAMNNNPTLSGKITGPGTLEITPAGTANWNMTLNNSSATATNDWMGGLILNGPASLLANVTVTLGSANQLNGNNVSFFSAGKVDTLNLNGKSDTVGALITTNTVLTTFCNVTNGSTTACTLTLGANNASGAYYGVIGDAGSSRAINLVKIGPGTQTFGGTLIYSGSTVINGGTLAFPLVTSFPSLSSSITVNSNASMDVSAITPLTMGNLNMSNGTVVIGLATGQLSATNFSALGSSNYVKLTTLPPVSVYPAQFHVIAYTNLTAGALNFGLAGLPGVAAGTPYAGYISNNVANNSVDLVLTAGPVGITWSGASSSAWDISTANWLTVGGNSTTYVNGENVTFPDGVSAKSVTLSQGVAPLSMVVSNTGATAYTFSDGGLVYPITAAGSLAKQGAGTLIFDNAATNSFAGGITIAAGTLQIGNTDANGGLAATTINDNSSLMIARTDTTTFGSSIQGTGGVIVQGGGTITLSGANSYTNTTQVNGNTILKAGNNAALGSAAGPTIISSGSTLDVNGYSLGTENVQASGAGTSGQGAIDNTGASQFNALASVTMTGDTTFGTSANRWDLRSPVSGSTNALLSTGGHAYNLTKVGGQTTLLVDTFVDPTLANIDIQGGTFGVQGATTGLGNPASTVTVESGATLFTYALTTPLNKSISLIGTLQHGSASATISGPIALSGGSSQVEVAPNTTLNLSGGISGATSLTMVSYPGSSTGSGTLNLNGTNTFTGGLNLYQGTVNLNGNNIGSTGGVSLNGGALSINSVLGGSLVSYITTALGGTGTVLGTAEVDGTFNPGASVNTAGTFIAGNGMTFDADSVLTFDLAPVNTTGSGVNDYLIVTNDLTVNGNVIAINLLAGFLQPGTYHLISYTGNLNGSFAGVQTAASISQTLTLDTSVAGQVNLIVSGVPDTLKWISQTTNNWNNDPAETNWLSLGGNTNAPFNGGNYVLFDDTPNVVTGISVGSGVVVLPAGITNNSSINNFTISGAGIIGGGGKLVKLGTSTLTLGTSNDISGVTVSGGILRLANGHALGRTNIPTVVNSGATLDIGGLALGNYPIVAAGSGMGGLGAIVNNSSVSQINALLNITLAGDTTIGGTNRWDLRATSATSSNAVLSTGGHAYNLTKVGTNQVWLVDALLDPALANINLVGGALGIQSTTTIGNPTNTLTIYSNADLAFYQTSNTFNKVIVMNDGAAMETANSSNIIGGAITLNGNGYFIGAGISMILTNVVGGPGSLIKSNGTSQLILTTSNIYTGNTLVSGGNLVLTGNGSISHSSTIIVSNSAIDVSGRSDKTLTLAAGQTLQSAAANGTIDGSLTSSIGATVSPGGAGVRGTLTITNATTLLGTTAMDLDEAAHTNDLITSTGGVTYGGTLNVSVITGTPSGGEVYKLFNAGTYSGNFSATNLPSLGSGLGWQWNPANGTLSVTQTVNLMPTNLVASVSGNLMILSWPADHIGWQIQVQTNSLNTGLGTNWVTIPGSGSVNAITNTLNPGNGSVFYRMIH